MVGTSNESLLGSWPLTGLLFVNIKDLMIFETESHLPETPTLVVEPFDMMYPPLCTK